MIRVAINGFGRIGRSMLRALYETGKYPDMQVVAINDVAEPEARGGGGSSHHHRHCCAGRRQCQPSRLRWSSSEGTGDTTWMCSWTRGYALDH